VTGATEKPDASKLSPPQLLRAAIWFGNKIFIAPKTLSILCGLASHKLSATTALDTALTEYPWVNADQPEFEQEQTEVAEIKSSSALSAASCSKTTVKGSRQQSIHARLPGPRPETLFPVDRPGLIGVRRVLN
jgi:hypothetical protein